MPSGPGGFLRSKAVYAGVKLIRRPVNGHASGIRTQTIEAHASNKDFAVAHLLLCGSSTMSTPIRYSQRPLPAVYYSSMELHLLVVRRLSDFRVPRGQSSPLLRAMRNTCTALFLASHG